MVCLVFAMAHFVFGNFVVGVCVQLQTIRIVCLVFTAVYF